MTKDDHGRSPFYQRVIRYGHGKDPRHESTIHKHDKTKIYPEQSGFEDYKQNPQNYYFW